MSSGTFSDGKLTNLPESRRPPDKAECFDAKRMEGNRRRYGKIRIAADFWLA